MHTWIKESELVRKVLIEKWNNVNGTETSYEIKLLKRVGIVFAICHSAYYKCDTHFSMMS